MTRYVLTRPGCQLRRLRSTELSELDRRNGLRVDGHLLVVYMNTVVGEEHTGIGVVPLRIEVAAQCTHRRKQRRLGLHPVFSSRLRRQPCRKKLRTPSSSPFQSTG